MVLWLTSFRTKICYTNSSGNHRLWDTPARCKSPVSKSYPPMNSVQEPRKLWYRLYLMFWFGSVIPTCWHFPQKNLRMVSCSHLESHDTPSTEIFRNLIPPRKSLVESHKQSTFEPKSLLSLFDWELPASTMYGYVPTCTLWVEKLLASPHTHNIGSLTTFTTFFASMPTLYAFLPTTPSVCLLMKSISEHFMSLILQNMKGMCWSMGAYLLWTLRRSGTNRLPEMRSKAFLDVQLRMRKVVGL